MQIRMKNITEPQQWPCELFFYKQNLVINNGFQLLRCCCTPATWNAKMFSANNNSGEEKIQGEELQKKWAFNKVSLCNNLYS